MRYILETQTWWIAHNNGELMAYGSGGNNNEVWVVRDNWETFDNEPEWKARLLQLGVDIDELEVENELI